MELLGSCNCGAVIFSIEATIKGLYQCHCTLCQKQSGSTSNTAVIVPEYTFQWVKGEKVITHWEKATGFKSDFCSVCGSPVPNKLRDTSFYWIPMGLINEAQGELPIISHIYCSSKASWDTLPSDSQHYASMPDDIDNFISKHCELD